MTFDDYIPGRFSAIRIPVSVPALPTPATEQPAAALPATDSPPSPPAKSDPGKAYALDPPVVTGTTGQATDPIPGFHRVPPLYRPAAIPMLASDVVGHLLNVTA